MSTHTVTLTVDTHAGDDDPDAVRDELRELVTDLDNAGHNVTAAAADGASLLPTPLERARQLVHAIRTDGSGTELSAQSADDLDTLDAILSGLEDPAPVESAPVTTSGQIAADGATPNVVAGDVGAPVALPDTPAPANV